MRITRSDLDHWLALAPALRWTFAKTYAEVAPHSWIHQSSTAEVDYEWAARVIQTFGEPQKYNGTTGIYLVDRDRGVKWWTLDRRLEDVTLVNQAQADVFYGVQDAPSTDSCMDTEWDEVATVWDEQRDQQWDSSVKRRIKQVYGSYAPKTLDVGCGTGSLLDSGVISPFNYTGLDPSRGMLNTLLHKWKWRVSSLIPSTLAEADITERYELVVAMDVPGVDLDRLQDLSTGEVIMCGRSGHDGC